MDTKQHAIILRDVTYMGGHPSAPNPAEKLHIEFDDRGIRFFTQRESLGQMPWRDVTELSVDAEVRRRRMSLPNVMFFGWLWAWLFQTTEKTSVLRIGDSLGARLFEVSGIEFEELQAGIAELERRHMRS